MFLYIRFEIGGQPQEFLKDEGRLVILIKPQFEAEKGQVPKGVVRDGNMHASIVGKVLTVWRIKIMFCKISHIPQSKGQRGISNSC
jgi:23S rRNA (cytidine1920-2'-O)/16S rRNA (cytidine1409-2'-O)-methyltransferase